MATPTRIRKGAKPRLYLTEWMEKLGINDSRLGERMDVNRATVGRWKKEPHRLDTEKIIALAEALDLTPEQLWRRPAPNDQPSLDDMVAGIPDDLRATVTDVVKRLVGKAS